MILKDFICRKCKIEFEAESPSCPQCGEQGDRIFKKAPLFLKSLYRVEKQAKEFSKAYGLSDLKSRKLEDIPAPDIAKTEKDAQRLLEQRRVFFATRDLIRNLRESENPDAERIIRGSSDPCKKIRKIT